MKNRCEVDLGQPGSYTIRTTTASTPWDLVCRSQLRTTTGKTAWIAYIRKGKSVIKTIENRMVIKEAEKKEPKKKFTPKEASNVVTISFNGLPKESADFGKKKITASACGKSSKPVIVEVFFKPEDTTHPGKGSGDTPNWFYYWAKTKAGKGNECLLDWMGMVCWFCEQRRLVSVWQTMD